MKMISTGWVKIKLEEILSSLKASWRWLDICAIAEVVVRSERLLEMIFRTSTWHKIMQSINHMWLSRPVRLKPLINCTEHQTGHVDPLTVHLSHNHRLAQILNPILVKHPRKKSVVTQTEMGNLRIEVKLNRVLHTRIILYNKLLDIWDSNQNLTLLRCLNPRKISSSRTSLSNICRHM